MWLGDSTVAYKSGPAWAAVRVPNGQAVKLSDFFGRWSGGGRALHNGYLRGAEGRRPDRTGADLSVIDADGSNLTRVTHDAGATLGVARG